MSTVFNRCWSYHKNTKAPLLTHDHVKKLGEQVFKKFKESGMRGYKYQEQKEPHFTGKVICYPKKFTPVIDQMIIDFYKSITVKI